MRNGAIGGVTKNTMHKHSFNTSNFWDSEYEVEKFKKKLNLGMALYFNDIDELNMNIVFCF